MEDCPIVTAKRLDHFGLIAGICKKIRLVELFDELLPKTRGAVKVSHGESVYAMILNGLGFKERRLYLTSHFYKDKATDKIFWDGFDPNCLNDDVLARTLDAIHKYGATKLFSELSIRTGLELDLYNNNLHVDTTSLSFSGRFKKQSENSPKITYGHSKDHRNDLPQLVLSLICGNNSGLPVFFNVHSGNTSDREIIPSIIVQFEEFLKLIEINKDFIYIADSALYSKRFLLDKKHTFNWLTRVPESIRAARVILSRDKSEFEWTDLGNGYQIAPCSHRESGYSHRWMIVSSRKAHFKEIATLEKSLKNEETYLRKRSGQLKRRDFYSQEEAKREVESLRKNHPLFKFEYTVRKAPKKVNYRGHRKWKASYALTISFWRNKERVDQLTNRKGRFILATNAGIEKLPIEEALKVYHGQSKVEGCFKFIKDRSFLLNRFYLKKTERAEALLFIMVMTLFVFNLGQHLLRKELTEKNLTLPNQLGQQKTSITFKWAFQIFQGINHIVIQGANNLWRMISELTAEQKIILECLPEAAFFYSSA